MSGSDLLQDSCSEAERLRSAVEQLRSRLTEAEETLRAVRHGEIDALLGPGTSGLQLFNLNALLEEMNEGAVALDVEGRMRYCNRRFAEIVHASIADALGRRLTEFVHPDDQPHYSQLLAAALEGRAAGDVIGLAIDGVCVPLRLSLSRMETNDGPAIAAVVTDQSESRRKTAALLQMRDELEATVRERTSTLAQANHELEKARVAALNMMKDAVAFSSALKDANAELRVEIEQRRLAEEEVRRLNAELEQRVRLRTSQLEAANRELEAFSYSVSHDLRAPLRAIEGFSRILFETSSALGEEERGHLERIGRAAEKMSQLIDDLLTLSRIGRRELNVRRVDLADLAKEVFAELREAEPDRNVECIVAGPLPALGDPSLLRIVLQNLLSNAWKFTSRQPQARIEVTSETTDDGVQYVVRDDGAGFDERYADRLFVPFQRLHSESEFKGTGIGLAIVHRVIARHGGRIRAESRVGQGTTFRFTLG